MDKSHYTPSSRDRQQAARPWYPRQMTTKTLIESWLAAEYAAGKNKTEATAALNKTTGMRYTLTRVLQWEKGERDVPAKARHHMIRVALPLVLEDLASVDIGGLSAAAIRKLADRLS